jgi:hypothetical protein
VVVAALLALTSPAFAVAVTESPPNNDISTALGPLAPDLAYSGAFETAGDVDWLYFYAAHGTGAVTVQVTKVGPGCSPEIRASLLNANGQAVQGSVPVASGMTAPLAAPPLPFATERFYIMLYHLGGTGCAGDPYSVTVGPSAAVTTVAPADEEPPVAAPQATVEPNETVATASGPLAPGTAYGGDFSSSADQDWLVFYTTNVFPTRVRITRVGEGCGNLMLAAVKADTGVVVGASGLLFGDTAVDIDFTPTGAARHYVWLTGGCAGERYQVRVGPANAVTATSPLIAFAPTPNPVATGEPNETPPRSFRVAGGIGYGAAVDASYDIDYFVFRVAAERQVEVSITKIGDGCSPRIETSVRKAAAPGTVLAEHHVSPNATLRHRFTADRLEDYLLRVSGTCAGDPYQLRIDPADAVVEPDADADGKPDSQDRCPTIASRSASGCPAKVKPRAMTLFVLPRRDARGPYRFRLAGSVRRPAALPAVAACRGRVALRLRYRTRTVAFATTPLRRDCKYGRTFTFANRRTFSRARGLSVTAMFRGNAVLRSATRRAVARVR